MRPHYQPSGPEAPTTWPFTEIVILESIRGWRLDGCRCCERGEVGFVSCRAKYVHLELVEKVQKHPRVTALPPNVLSIARLKASLQGCHTVHPMARSGLGPCDAPRAPPAPSTRGTHSSKRARPVPGSIPGLDHTLHNTTPLPFHPPTSALYAFRRGLARRATPRTRLF